MSSLCTYYGKEIGKERSSETSGKGTKDVYVSKLPFFASLHFLRSIANCRGSWVVGVGKSRG